MYIANATGNLGGKFGAEVASVFDTDQVSDLWNYTADQLRQKLGQEQGSWVYNTCRGIDYSEVNPRTKIKSMLRFSQNLIHLTRSAKNFQPPVNNFEAAARWLRVLTADLASRVNEDEDHRRPRTLTIHHRSGGVTKSRQAPLPLTKDITKEFLCTHALSLWRGIEAEGRAYPAINISVAISGFGDVEDGVQGIQGFLVKAPGPNQIGHTSVEKDVLGKRKREDSGIAKFFPKTEEGQEHSPEAPSPEVGEMQESTVDVEMDLEEDVYTCPRCQKKIPIVEMEVHDDYHVALEFAKGSPARAPPMKAAPSVQSKPKISKTEKKGPKKKGNHVEKGQRKLEFGI